MGSSADTIFAPASGLARAALSVIRLSGPNVRLALERMAGGVPAPRRLVLRRLKDASGEILDEALVVFMPGPASYTGEDQAELHIHGGLATRAAVIAALSGLPDCRAAEPGEFTRRAFLAGRLDLAQAEGLADLIDAETEAQRRQALRQLGGRLGDRVESWREAALAAMSLAEAAIDFADEGDVPEGLIEEAQARARALAREMAEILADRRGERLREGFSVVLAGAPNAGKSTLLNALARREAAIVSDIPGTTRDAIEIRCDFNGLPVSITDTAGLRDSADPIEREGVSRTWRHIGRADLVLWLEAPDVAESACSELPDNVAVIRIATKCDLPGPRSVEGSISVSALSGAGMEALERAIENAAAGTLAGADSLLTRGRHRQALEQARDALERAAGADPDYPELIAEDIRHVLDALGRITGRVGIEDVLDRLFGSFCIGK